MIDVLHGDGLTVLRTLPDASVDAIVTDPPYCSGSVSEAGRQGADGQGLRSNSESAKRFGWFKADNMGTAGLAWLLRAIAFESTRLLRDGGSLCVFCDWRMVANIEPAIESSGLRFRNLLVWDKGTMGLGTGFRMQHELALHFTNGSGASFYDRSVGNVLRARRVHVSDREHPTQKPVDLMAQIIRVVSPPGGMVVDPFAGSGSTLVACALEGRRAIGVERDREYVGIATRRVAEASTQTRIDP